MRTKRSIRQLSLAAAAALLLVPSIAAARQSVGDYLTLKDAYIKDPDRAIAALAAWPRRAIEEGVNACLRPRDSSTKAPLCSVQQRLAAATLHTDVALQLADPAPDLSAFHQRTAAALLPRAAEADTFVQRWFEFATLLNVSQGRFQTAAAFADEGLRRFPRDWRLRLAMGRLFEHRAVIDLRDPRGRMVYPRSSPGQAASAGRRVFETLMSAMASYHSALDLNPDAPVVQLRVGWVYVLLKDGRARPPLDDALRRAGSDATRYLAHLYLGAHAENDDRLDDARQEYEAARAAGPRFQSACVALSQAEDALGRPARARALAEECLTMASGGDPAMLFARGLPEPGLLEWLRQEGRRP